MPPAKKRASAVQSNPTHDTQHDRNMTVSITYCCTARNGKDANTARLDSHTSSVKNVILVVLNEGKKLF